MKNIVFILPDLRKGGAQRVILNLISELNNEFKISLILFNYSNHESNYNFSNTQVFNLSKTRLLKSVFPLIFLLNKIKPDIVFSTLGHVNIVLLLIKVFILNKPKIWIREANMPSLSIPNWDKSLLIKSFYKLLYKYADKLICSSYQMKKEFEDNFSISSNKTDVLYNPVDIKTIRYK